jgi:YHS domain-containing protein
MTNLQTNNKAVDAVIDPVCRMEVYPGRTRLMTIYHHQTYWFCSLHCRSAFEMNPQKYLDLKEGKRKGWFQRYAKRMARINKEEFST